MAVVNAKALVTGDDGFIGSHLTELLLNRSYKVRALSYYNSFNHWGWLEDIPVNKKLEIVTGDIRDPHFVKKIVEGIDIVFHVAALTAITYSCRTPDSYVDNNIKGTLNVCQAAKESVGIRVLNTSTSEVYGTAQYIPIDEKHPNSHSYLTQRPRLPSDFVGRSTNPLLVEEVSVMLF